MSNSGLTSRTVTTADLQPGDRVRLFESWDFQTVANVAPLGSRGAMVIFEDGTRTSIGRGAEWSRETTCTDEGTDRG